MDKKPYTSVEHSIRNIMEAATAKAPRFKGTPSPFTKTARISPPKGEEHPSKSVLNLSGQRRTSKEQNAGQMEESGAVDPSDQVPSVAELSAHGSMEDGKPEKKKKKIKESASSDRKEIEFISRPKDGEPTEARRAIVIIARLKDEMPKSKKSTLGKNAATKQRRVDEQIKAVIKDEQKKKKGKNPLVDFDPHLHKETDDHNGDSKIVKEDAAEMARNTRTAIDVGQMGVGGAGLAKLGTQGALKGASYVPGLTKGATAAGSAVAKAGSKSLPVIGNVLSGASGLYNLGSAGYNYFTGNTKKATKDITDAGLDFAGMLPVVGNAINLGIAGKAVYEYASGNADDDDEPNNAPAQPQQSTAAAAAPTPAPTTPTSTSTPQTTTPTVAPKAAAPAPAAAPKAAVPAPAPVKSPTASHMNGLQVPKNYSNISSTQQPPAIRPSQAIIPSTTPSSTSSVTSTTPTSSGGDVNKEREFAQGSAKRDMNDYESGKPNKKRISESYLLEAFNNYRKINN